MSVFDYDKEAMLFREELLRGEHSIITLENREANYYAGGAEESKEKRDTAAIGKMLSSGCFDNLKKMK